MIFDIDQEFIDSFIINKYLFYFFSLLQPKNQQIQDIMAGQSGDSTDEDSSNLTVPHSNMTKSLSTPSIPAATNAVILQGLLQRIFSQLLYNRN